MSKRSLFLMLSLLFVFSVASAQEAKTIRITPAWIKQHPKRIEIGGGTAVSGRNDYFIKLVLDRKADCNIQTKFVATKTDYEPDPPDLTMYETSVRTEAPTKTVRLTFRENKPYSLKPIYRIAVVANASDPGDAEHWVETSAYIIDLRQYDELHDAFLAATKR